MCLGDKFLSLIDILGVGDFWVGFGIIYQIGFVADEFHGLNLISNPLTLELDCPVSLG